VVVRGEGGETLDGTNRTYDRKGNVFRSGISTGFDGMAGFFLERRERRLLMVPLRFLVPHFRLYRDTFFFRCSLLLFQLCFGRIG